jgi:putative CocE/NonD family hydrolase
MDMPGVGDILIERDLIVRARDGVGLATDVYRPPGRGPFPVLLERTPYDKSVPSRSERTADETAPRSRAEVAFYFVRHGYAVVYQDCRGRYKSDGRFTKYLSEAEDGYDTLAWLLRQSWCNGRIGTFGLSYAAHAQAALGCLDPAGLAAQFLDCGGFSNAYRSGIRHGGAFDLKQATWAYNNALADAKDPAVKAELRAQDIKGWFARMPWRKGHSPVSAASEYEDYLFQQWSHGTFDDFWKQPGITRKVITIVTPMCRSSTSRAGTILRANRGGELPRPVAEEARPGAPDPRSLDAWRALADLWRRRRFRSRGPGRRQSRGGFLCTAKALVRPLAEGRRE